MASVEERVKQIIVEQLGVDEAEVTPTASFVDDLGADSLDTVELVMAFEEAFGIEIPDEDAEKIATVKDASTTSTSTPRPRSRSRSPESIRESCDVEPPGCGNGCRPGLRSGDRHRRGLEESPGRQERRRPHHPFRHHRVRLPHCRRSPRFRSPPAGSRKKN